MGIKKIITFWCVLSYGAIIPTFQQNIAYVLSFPNYSTWGIFNAQGAVGATLAQTAGMSLLQNCTITNNNGKQGVVRGLVNEFQLVPSLAKGVKYWNPLSQINAIQPSLLETFVPNNAQLTQPCQAPEVLFVDTGKSLSAQSSTAVETDLDKRYKTISSASDVVFVKEYQDLYANLQKKVTNLVAIKQSMQNKGDFFSALYLKFAATYGNQFVNQAALQQLSSSVFGKDIDISSYFQGGVFPITCDLAMASGGGGNRGQKFVDASGNDINGGPLVRASQMGLISSRLDVTSLLTQVPTLTSVDIQNFLQDFVGGVSKNSMIYNRARVTELFFLYLGVLMGSNLVAGAPTYDEGFCADSSCPGSSWCPTPSPCEKMSSMPFSFYSTGSHYCFAQICSKLSAAARYVSILHNNTTSKNMYTPQPVDTFYGMIVLNQSSYTIGSNNVMIAPGQVGMLKGSPGVDMWNAEGVNPDSNYKYRSVSCNLLKANGNGVVELRVEENFDTAHYDSTKTYVPAITIFNGIAKTQKDIVAKGYLENFFKVDSAVGWAVVLQLVEQPTSSNSSTLVLNMVGLARLNPYDFPLVYRGPGLDTLSVGAFSALHLWQAPFLVYSKIVASKKQAGSDWVLCSNDQLPQMSPIGTVLLPSFVVKIPGNDTAKTITPDPINPYYVAYQSALSADFGGKTSLQTALENSIDFIKKAYFTYDNLSSVPLISLIKKASENPHDVIVQVTTTEDYRLAV